MGVDVLCVGELVGCEDREFDERKAWPLYRRGLLNLLGIRMITRGLLEQQSSIKSLFGESDVRNRVEVDI
jgi:hypothetical protein